MGRTSPLVQMKFWVMHNADELFLMLVRLGIGTISNVSQPGQVDWHGLETIAERQRISAIMLDGIERLPNGKRPPKELLLQWIGSTVQSFEYRYVLYRHTIAELAGFYNRHGFQMMILKGYACSINWPKPEHRPYGDIDIWLFGRQKDADALMSKELGIKVDASHHHHTVFNWRDFTVENHYDFVNVHARKSSADLEKIFKELGSDDSHSVAVNGEKVYLPSPNLHALFLIRHMVSHFASSGISLRQVLDWAFFVEKHTQEVDWQWLLPLLEEYHMIEFFNCINAICIEDLGFAPSIFPYIQFSPELKARVLSDILEPEYTAEEPNGFVRRIVYKYHRWQGNAWKQRLCYNESRWSMFWTGIWAKILKPASI